MAPATQTCGVARHALAKQRVRRRRAGVVALHPDPSRRLIRPRLHEVLAQCTVWCKGASRCVRAPRRPNIPILRARSHAQLLVQKSPTAWSDRQSGLQ